MPRSFIEVNVRNVRNTHLPIPAAHPIPLRQLVQHISQHRPPRRKQRQPRPHQVRRAEQIQLPPQLPVVARLRLLLLLQIRLQFLFGCKRHPINPRQHLPFLVPPPIRPRNPRQLPRPHLRQILQVRPLTQVRKQHLFLSRIPKIIERNFLFFRQILNQLHLILLSAFSRPFQRLRPRHLPTHHLAPPRDDSPHLLLNLLQVRIGHLLPTEVHVVIKSVLNRRSYPKGCCWIKLLHRRRHHMAQRMSHLFGLFFHGFILSAVSGLILRRPTSSAPTASVVRHLFPNYTTLCYNISTGR